MSDHWWDTPEGVIGDVLTDMMGQERLLLTMATEGLCEVGREITAALRGKRYAIVELPESGPIPEGIGYMDCVGEWNFPLGPINSGVSLAAWNDDHTISDVDGSVYTPQQARLYAAALLAAADAAEREQ